jgi:hypothetical protein
MVEETTRKQHVWRQQNEDDDEVWIDLLRVDKLVTTKGQQNDWQKVTYNIKWDDEENPADHPTRTLRVVEVANPEDEEQIIEVHTIAKMRTMKGDQKITHSFLGGEVTSQKVQYRRIYHYDADDPEPPCDLEDYVRDEATIDQEQYLDVRVIERMLTRGQDGQVTLFNFDNRRLYEFSVPTPEDELDLEKVVFLDPLQNIVNVQWGGDNMIIAASIASDVQIFTYTGDGGWIARGILGTGLFEPIILDEGGDDENFLYPGNTYAAAYSKAGKFFLFGGSFSELGGYEPIVDGTTIIRTEDGINWETVSTIHHPPDPGLHGEFCTRLLYNSIDEYVVTCLAAAFPEGYRYSWKKSVDGRTWETATAFSHPFQMLPSHLAEVTHGTVTDDEGVSRKIWLRRVEETPVEVPGGTILFPVSNSIDVAFQKEGPWTTVTTGVGNPSDVLNFHLSFYQVAIGGGVAVVCGGKKLAATRNGTTWSVVLDAAIFGSAGFVMTVAYLAGKFFTSFSGNTETGIYESSDGYTWTVSTDPVIPVHPFTAAPFYLLSGRVPDPDV